MTPVQVVALAVRLFAIWLVVYLLPTAGGVFLALKDFDRPDGQFIAVTVAFLTIALIVVLWKFPLVVARRVLPSATPTLESASPDTWFATGCALIGLWVLTQAVPGLVRYAVVLFLSVRNGPTIADDWHYGFVYHIAQLVIGFWLLLGTRGARKLFRWARYADTP